jgi:hypothetical protein
MTRAACQCAGGMLCVTYAQRRSVPRAAVTRLHPQVLPERARGHVLASDRGGKAAGWYVQELLRVRLALPSQREAA